MTTGLLLSGGIDSSALAFWKRPQVCFTVDYGHSRPPPKSAPPHQLRRTSALAIRFSDSIADPSAPAT